MQVAAGDRQHALAKRSQPGAEATADVQPNREHRDHAREVLSTQGDLKAEDSEGTLHFDSAKGRLHESKSSCRVKGKLTIESALGRGTIVTVWFPPERALLLQRRARSQAG